MIERAIVNSSPLIALSRINRLGILQDTFRDIIAPDHVLIEVGVLPAWVRVMKPNPLQKIPGFPAHIHKGEAEVLALGFDIVDSVLVLDDWYAREFALRHSLRVIGTVGLILRAKREHRIDAVTPILNELIVAGFRLSKQVYSDALRLAGE